MLILGNYKGNYDTATTTAIKSMGFDLNVTQSYFRGGVGSHKDGELMTKF